MTSTSINMRIITVMMVFIVLPGMTTMGRAIGNRNHDVNSSSYNKTTWGIVKIMVPFWVP